MKSSNTRFIIDDSQVPHNILLHTPSFVQIKYEWGLTLLGDSKLSEAFRKRFIGFAHIYKH